MTTEKTPEELGEEFDRITEGFGEASRSSYVALATLRRPDTGRVETHVKKVHPDTTVSELWEWKSGFRDVGVTQIVICETT